MLRERRVLRRLARASEEGGGVSRSGGGGSGESAGGGGERDRKAEEEAEMAEVLAVLEEELWERRAREEAFARLCTAVLGDLEKVSYAMRNDPGMLCYA
jgi:hypothetical protein